MAKTLDESGNDGRDDEKQNFLVYKPTTIVKENEQTTEMKTKKKRRDKSDLGDDFIAPNGGWGWLICIAAGISNVSIHLIYF